MDTIHMEAAEHAALVVVQGTIVVDVNEEEDHMAVRHLF